jgi:hypothetical protein
MMRDFIGGSTIVSAFMPKKKRKMKNMISSVSAVGVLAGAGIAYMAIRRNKEHND